MRSLAALLALALAAGAAATPEYLELWKKTYPASKAGATGCVLCHTQVPRHNAYGTDVRRAGEPLTAALLHGLDAKDSDGDGWSNGDEIAAGTLPGDAKNHPPGKPATAPAKPPEKAPEPTVEGLIPAHTFHPAIVHFPIALFLFGAFAQLWGRARGDGAFRRTGETTAAAGAGFSVLSAATGLIAALRLGYPLTPGGPVFLHLALAAAATATMIGVVVARRRGADGAGYALALVVAAVLTGAAGHFGGNLVFAR